ncbi:hypothetical protein CK203_003643 [Vitis vinifera]|uniref:Uncharacterized protein n=1 Tax=Vitis vinifera TaxID=29760 RepID=A0A438K7Y1_VITVI|nr:hypothetical protein CK203_003643 [Vitis vinifera]
MNNPISVAALLNIPPPWKLKIITISKRLAKITICDWIRANRASAIDFRTDLWPTLVVIAVLLPVATLVKSLLHSSFTLVTLQITGLVAFLGIDLGSVIGQRLEYCMYSVGGPESIPPVDLLVSFLQITHRFVHGHSNARVQIIGLSGPNKVLGHLDLIEPQQSPLRYSPVTNRP